MILLFSLKIIVDVLLCLVVSKFGLSLNYVQRVSDSPLSAIPSPLLEAIDGVALSQVSLQSNSNPKILDLARHHSLLFANGIRMHISMCILLLMHRIFAEDFHNV